LLLIELRRYGRTIKLYCLINFNGINVIEGLVETMFNVEVLNSLKTCPENSIRHGEDLAKTSYLVPGTKAR